MSENPRIVLAAAFMAGMVLLLAGIMLTPASPFFALLPVGLLCALAGAAFVMAVISGARWASALLLVVMVIVFTINLRGDVDIATRQQFDIVSMSRLGLYVLALLCGLAAIRQTYRRLLDFPALLLVGYIGLALITAPFSLTIAYSLGMVFALTSWLLYAASLPERFETSRILALLITAGGIFCVFSLVAYYVFPEYGRFVSPAVNIMRLKGLAATPNEAGQIASLLVIMVAALYFSGAHRQAGHAPVAHWPLLLCLPAITVLLMAGSRGALASLIVTLLVLAVQKLRLSRVALGLLFPLILFIAISVLASPWLVDFAEDRASAISRTGDAGEVSSLAGRSNVWSFAAERILEKPVTGYGFGAGSRLIQQGFQTRWGETTGSAHNAFLQSALDLGLPGVALLLAVFAWSFWRFLSDPSPFRDGVFVFVLFTCLLESGIAKPTSTLALIWLISLMAESPAREAERRKATSEAESGSTWR